jgi:DNA-binding LacI/PurR family transcriptional regulator
LAPSALRRKGYLSACRRLGLEPRIETTDHPYPEEGGAIAARAVLDSGRVPTAFVCVNDQTCFGASMVASRAGLSIPRDLSVTGFDDSRLAAGTFFDLTTAKQDPRAMGTRAIQTLLRRIDDRALAPQESIIKTKLIVRSSTAAPKGRRGRR